MEDLLGQLTKIRQRLDKTLSNYQRNHALWAKWLHWAKKDTLQFDSWAYEQAMKQSELKADPRDIAKAYRDIEPKYSFLMGAIYWSERHSFHAELEQLRLQRGKLLHRLWTEQDENGKWKYSLAQIAKAYGNTDDAMYKKLKLNEWFVARRSPGQKVISINRTKDLRATHGQ
jgi:hypothetical protein